MVTGDYPYYDDPEGPERFFDNILYHFDFIGDKFVIEEWRRHYNSANQHQGDTPQKNAGEYAGNNAGENAGKNSPASGGKAIHYAEKVKPVVK